MFGEGEWRGVAGFREGEGCVGREVEGRVGGGRIDGNALALLRREGELFVCEDILEKAGAQGTDEVQGKRAERRKQSKKS